MTAFEFGQLVKQALGPTAGAAPTASAAMQQAVDMSSYPAGHNTRRGPGVPRRATLGEVQKVLQDNPFVPFNTLNNPQKQMLPAYSRNPAAGLASPPRGTGMGALRR